MAEDFDNWGDIGGWDVEKATTPAIEEAEVAPVSVSRSSRRRTVPLYEIPDKVEYRRAFSELKLLEATDLKTLEDGHSYHFLTCGDVDSISFLMLVLQHLKRLDYCLFSTWVMAAEDVLRFGDWLKSGTIGRLDCYLGEHFPNQYKVEYRMLCDIVEGGGYGRVAHFRNHSKIMAGWCGERFFVIESSANINTNPRNEQGVITMDKGLALFYKDYFDGIKSF